MPKVSKPKRKGYGLEARTFSGVSGKTYLVFRTLDGGFHTFVEVESKEAAKDWGGSSSGGKNTRQMWKSLWT
jgi:hypothetical protein